MTDKLTELIDNLDKIGIEIDGQNLAILKDKINSITIPIKPLGFYVLVKVEKVEQTVSIKNAEGEDVDLYMHTDDMLSREQEANSKGWILAFGPTAYRGFAGPGEDGMCADAADWGLEIGDYVEFQSYNGILSAFEDVGKDGKKQKTLRIIPDSNIICKVAI